MARMWLHGKAYREATTTRGKVWALLGLMVDIAYFSFFGGLIASIPTLLAYILLRDYYLMFLPVSIALWLYIVPPIIYFEWTGKELRYKNIFVKTKEVLNDGTNK